MPQLSDVAVRAAKPAATAFTLWDDATAGFGCRVYPGGQKSFIVLISSGRRQTIGRYGPGGLTLSEARAEARRILAEKTLGKIKPTHTAFDDARDLFLKDCETRLRPLSVKLYRRHLTNHFPFGRQGLADITARDILRHLNPLKLSEKEHAHRIGRTFFAWCIGQHLMDTSPLARVPKPKPGASRERVLSEEELKAVYRTSLKLASGFQRLVCLLIHTGGRRGEMTALKWANVSDNILTLPAETTKGNRTRVVPIGAHTRAIFGCFPRTGEYVFPAARDTMHGKPTTIMTGYSAAKRAFDRECGVTGWTLHDLRRVYAVNLQKLGTRLETIETLLGHVGSRGGIVGVYQLYDFAGEARQAVEKWEGYLHMLTAPAIKPEAV